MFCKHSLLNLTYQAHSLVGGVAHEDVVVDERAEGEVAEGAGHRVAEGAHGDGRDGGDGEVPDGAVAHAGVDGDDGDVALVAEADVRHDEEEVRPGVHGRRGGGEE